MNNKVNAFIFAFVLLLFLSFFFLLAELRRFTVLNVPLHTGKLELIFFSLKLLIELLINFTRCSYQVVNCSYEQNCRSIASFWGRARPAWALLRIIHGKSSLTQIQLWMGETLGWGSISQVERLPSMCGALCSMPWWDKPVNYYSSTPDSSCSPASFLYLF